MGSAHRPYSVYPAHASYSHYAYGKRSADANAQPEADARLAFGGYGGYRGYRGYGLSTYSAPRTYSAYPARASYSHYSYGKRSADADAHPEADAGLAYRGYGGYRGYRGYGLSTYSAPRTYGYSAAYGNGYSSTYGAYPYN